MRIIAKRTIAEFGAKNPAARTSLEHWLRVTSAAVWTSTGDGTLEQYDPAQGGFVPV